MSASTVPASGKKPARGCGVPFGEEIAVGFGVGVGVGEGGDEHEATISRTNPNPASDLLARIGAERLDPVIPLIRSFLAFTIPKPMTTPSLGGDNREQRFLVKLNRGFN
jgi:hypothetical protein